MRRFPRLFSGGTRRLTGAAWTPDWLAAAGQPPRATPLDPALLAASFRCASILSDALAAQTPQVAEPLPSGGKDRLTATDAARALRLTSYASWETALMQSALGGNGFMQVHRNERGGPKYLSAIPARLISVVLDDRGRAFYEISEDEQTAQRERTLPAEDVVHIRCRSTDNPLVGVSPLRAAGASIAGVVATFALRENLYRNLSVAGLAFSTEMELTGNQMGELRKAIDAQTKQLAAGGSLILSSGLKIDRNTNGTSANDQSLIDGLKFSVEEISRVYGVPPSMLAQAGDSSFATASEERRAFLTSTLSPWAARVADELSLKLLAPDERSRGVAVAYDFGDALLGFGTERAETLSKLVNSGIYSVNDARNLQGLSDVPGGDVLRAPANNYPLENWLDFAPPVQNPDVPSPAPQDDAGDAPEDNGDEPPMKNATGVLTPAPATVSHDTEGEPAPDAGDGAKDDEKAAPVADATGDTPTDDDEGDEREAETCEPGSS